MPEYDNELQGVLFKNAKKTSDKHPAYRGEITIKGEKYRLSAWLNESRSGEKYMKLKAEVDGEYQSQQGGGQPAQTQAQQPPAAPPQAALVEDDDIPF